jgi:Zn-dependent peptidase ImmA (M78 family)
MAKSIPALVEPSVLRWARESIGYIPVAASRKIGVPDDRVDQWEAGAVAPTIAQLRKAAEVYKRPLAVFFLPEPPRDFDVMRDFRRHVGSGAADWSPELHAEYRRALAQREDAVELFEIEDVAPSTLWRVDSLPNDDERLAAEARALLLAHAPLPLPQGVGTKYQHLNTWTAALEEVGVLVMSTSGGRVSTQEMRAFSLFYNELPVIMLNGADSVRGRLFSLVHEYAHLLLNRAGLCDTQTDTSSTNPDRQLEARCNAIAAAILMPPELVLASPEVVDRSALRDSWDYPALRDAAAPFGTSAEAFARRLLTLGRIDADFYRARRAEFLTAYQREEDNDSASGGNWYRITARDLGKGFVRRIVDAYHRRVIDSYTAATFLNVKVEQIDRLAEMATLSESA